MNRSRPARGCGVRRRAILVVALLGVAAGAETAAETAAPTATATASQRLQQRFVASVEGWRKTAPKLSDKKPPESPPAHEAQLLRELRVVVAPTAVPVLRVQRRGDGHTLIVSAGWLALLDELLRAEAAYTMPPAGGTRCFDDYVDQVLAVVYDNGERASRQQPQPLQAWPRFASWLEADDTPTACKRIHPTLWSGPAAQQRISEAADTAVLWLLTQQAAYLVALPVPKAAASATFAASAAAKSTSGPDAAAAAPGPAASSPEQLAQHALEGYGLKPPAALQRLRERAPKLFH